MFNKKKQRGAAAIEYAILAAAMSVVLLNFVGGENGDLTEAITDTYQTVVDQLSNAQKSE
ncbi:Flp family type IVb pilin [Photobacterium sp. ZSDE20]|nr:Flp family type IVb pilin [Photobacterium sp. ZSDE20]